MKRTPLSLLAITAAIVALPATAHADRAALLGAVGFGARGEYDDVRVDVDGLPNFESDENGDEDLESNLGLAAMVDFEVSGALSLGGALNVVGADGEESEGKYLTVDLGLLLRYPVALGDGVNLDLLGAAGPTWVTLEEFGDIEDYDFSGLGYHLMLGAMVDFALSKRAGLGAGLVLSRQAVGELSAEGELLGRDATVTLEDGVITRVYLMVGLTWDL